MHIKDYEFEAYMERILEQIQLLHEKADKLLAIKGKNDIKLLDNQDLCQLLNVNQRTLQRYRAKGILKSVRIGGKIHYTRESIQALIKYQRENP